MILGTDTLSNLGPYVLLILVPFVLIIATSFAKIVVVLGITRSALGAQVVIPTMVLMALAVVMSIFIMAPVATDVVDALDELEDVAATLENDVFGIARAKNLYAAISPPLIEFLRLNTSRGEVEFFEQLANVAPSRTHGLRIMLPAFASSELVEALLMGVLIFLPFWVIDLLVSNVLLALGMHMMSPTVVSFPLKLFLFIAADGWHLIVSGLVVSYGM